MTIFPRYFSTAMDTETMTHTHQDRAPLGLGTCQGPAISLCVPNELSLPDSPHLNLLLILSFLKLLFWGICDTSSPLAFLLLCCPCFSVQIQSLRLLIGHLPDSSHLPPQLHVPSLCCSVHIPLTPDYVFAFLQVPCSDLFKTFPHVAPCA